MTTGTTSKESPDLFTEEPPRKVAAHDLPIELRTLFCPEMFSLTLRALADFKMPVDRAAKEIAELCNLTFMKFIANTSRAVDFNIQDVPHPRHQTWLVSADRTSKVPLPDNFRGRVICVGPKKNS